nr:unnamed protein product [Spirometra erinaceieuropaei]
MARVTDNGAVSEALAVTNGVKQGCLPEPTLFGVMFFATLMDAYRDERPWIHNGHFLNHRRMHFQLHVSTTTVHKLLFADDCVLNFTSGGDKQRSMAPFAAACENFFLAIRTDKTVVMHRLTSDAAYVALQINMNDFQLQVVGNFTYLDRTITRTTNFDDEEACRISKASQAFGCLQSSAWNRHGHHLNTKLKIYKAVIMPKSLMQRGPGRCT